MNEKFSSTQNHLYTTAYTCLYARQPDELAQADFLPYFGEVWWPGLPEPRIAQPNVSFHNIVFHVRSPSARCVQY